MNMLERCAALLTAAQADPTRREHFHAQAYPELDAIIGRSARRKIANDDLKDDAVQRVHIAIWEHITTKPGPVTPVLLRMLIDGRISNAIRDDTRARRRNGDPASGASNNPVDARFGEAARHRDVVAAAHTAPWDRIRDGEDTTVDRVILLERLTRHATGTNAAA